MEREGGSGAQVELLPRGQQLTLPHTIYPACSWFILRQETRPAPGRVLLAVAWRWVELQPLLQVRPVPEQQHSRRLRLTLWRIWATGRLWIGELGPRCSLYGVGCRLRWCCSLFTHRHATVALLSTSSGVGGHKLGLPARGGLVGLGTGADCLQPCTHGACN